MGRYFNAEVSELRVDRTIPNLRSITQHNHQRSQRTFRALERGCKNVGFRLFLQKKTKTKKTNLKSAHKRRLWSKIEAVLWTFSLPVKLGNGWIKCLSHGFRFSLGSNSDILLVRGRYAGCKIQGISRAVFHGGGAIIHA